MLQNVDFAAACFSITAGREAVVDFAQPYFYESSAVILKRPHSENKVALYLKPFSWQVTNPIWRQYVNFKLIDWHVTWQNNVPPIIHFQHTAILFDNKFPIKQCQTIPNILYHESQIWK